jgi:hypothetical protein
VENGVLGGKQTAPSKRDAQRLADEFMEKVNARNNEPGLYPSDDETLTSLVAKCREKTWPHLKNSTRQHYEFFMNKYLLPTWGTRSHSTRYSRTVWFTWAISGSCSGGTRR